jgi:uncharacterized protein with PIN domain
MSITREAFDNLYRVLTAESQQLDCPNCKAPHWEHSHWQWDYCMSRYLEKSIPVGQVQ